MSDDLIKRSDAIAEICKVRTPDVVSHQYAEMFINAVCRAPSADRPQGEWIWSPRDTDGTVSGCCSNCSFSHLFIGGHTAQYNYCPSCGARMKGADDEH